MFYLWSFGTLDIVYKFCFIVGEAEILICFQAVLDNLCSLAEEEVQHLTNFLIHLLGKTWVRLEELVNQLVANFFKHPKNRFQKV